MRYLGDYKALGRKTNRDGMRRATEIPDPVSDLTWGNIHKVLTDQRASGSTCTCKGFCWINILKPNLSLNLNVSDALRALNEAALCCATWIAVGAPPRFSRVLLDYYLVH